MARCFPVPLARDGVPIYQTTDPLVEVGVLTRATATDLQLCRIEGEWARVYLMPMFYWVRLEDIAPDPRTERIVRLELPPNGEVPSPHDWCHEAVTTGLRTPVFFRDDRDVVVEAQVLPRWTPLIACGREGAWTDVQFKGRRGFAETRHLLVSSAQRERTRGFDAAVTCRTFYWKARTEHETPMYRWSPTGELEERRLPPGRELEVNHASGPWLWVGHGGEWGYVARAEVALSPQVFESSRIADRPEECGGMFQRGTAGAEVPLFQSARSDEVLLAIPPGAEFIVYEQAEEGRRAARYLAVAGWVPEEGWTPSSGWTSHVDARVPEGFQPDTLVSLVEAVEHVPWDWRVGLLLGPAVSGDLPRPGALVDVVAGLRLGGSWIFAAGVSGLVSDRVNAAASDLGASVRWEWSSASYLDLWLAASVQRIDADEVGLGVGGRVTLTLGVPLVRPYEVGLAYTFRGSRVVACTGDRPCEGSGGWFLHAVQAVLSVRL